MKINYNLTEEKWIQAVSRSDGQIRKYSLREILLNAHDVKEIFYESPLEEIAVYRFLQAITIHMTECNTSRKKWDSVFAGKQFDAEQVNRYFEDNSQYFDLFDKERPFYQNPTTKRSGSSAKENPFPNFDAFLLDKRSGTKARLFDHSMESSAYWIELNRIAVGIVTLQAFFMGQGRGHFDGIFFPKGIFWAKKKSLFSTLLFNSMYIRKNVENGAPSWLKVLPVKSEKTYVTDYLGYLTWQSRKIKIILPDIIEDNNYNPVLKQIKTGNNSSNFRFWHNVGLGLKEDANFIDPAIAYEFKTDTKLKKMVWSAWRLPTNKRIWQEAKELYSNSTERKAPGLFHNLSYYDQNPNEVSVYGTNKDGKTIAIWRRVEMPYFPQLFKDEEQKNKRYELMVGLLKDCEYFANLLKFTSFDYALFSKVPKLMKIGNKYRTPDGNEYKIDDVKRKEINAIVAKLNLETNYWAELEKPFYKQLEFIAGNDDFDETELKESWRKQCFNTALRIFDEAVDNSESENFKAHQIAKKQFFYTKEGDE